MRPGAKYYQYVDQVFSELNVEYDQEGMFKPTFKTVGSGLLIPSATSMDTTPTEVAGPPAEMMNWSTLTDGVDEGIVQKLSLNASAKSSSRCALETEAYAARSSSATAP